VSENNESETKEAVHKNYRAEVVGSPSVGRGVLDWIGLDWTGLDWTGLDWTGLDWTGLDWTGLDWTGLDWTPCASQAFAMEILTFQAIDIFAFPSTLH
jgi:hypothetical protein